MSITTDVLAPNWKRMRSSLLEQLGAFEAGKASPSLSPERKSQTVARLNSMIGNLDSLLSEYGTASRLCRRGAMLQRERAHF
jgi:hypothetical protein